IWAPLEADDSSVFGPLPDVEAQRTSVLPPPQTPLPPPYAGLGVSQPPGDFELDLPASAEPQALEAPGPLERTMEEPLPMEALPAEPELQLGRLPELPMQGPGDDTLSRLDFEAGNVDMKAAVNRYYTPPPFRTPAEGLRAAVAPPESFDEVPPAEAAPAEPAGSAPDLSATVAYVPQLAGLPPFSVGDSSVFGAPIAPLPADDDGVFGPAVAGPAPSVAGGFDAAAEPELPPSPYGSSGYQPAAPLFSSLDPIAGAEDRGAPAHGEPPGAPEPRIAWASEEMEAPVERPRSSRPDGTTRLSGEVRHDETLVFAASQPTRRSPLFFVVVAAALLGGAYVAIRYVKPRMGPATPAGTEQPAAATPVPAAAEPTPSTSAPPEPTVPVSPAASGTSTSPAAPPPTAVPTAAPPAPTATSLPTPKAATPTPSAPAVAAPPPTAQSAPVPVPVSTRPLQPAPSGKARAQTMVSKDWAGKEPVFVIHFVSGKDRKIVEKEALAIGKRLGLVASTIEVDLGEKGIWFRAVVGEFGTVDEALAKHAELKAAETKGMGLVYRLAGN
ncbi:MAG: hypothetical protein JNK60_08485, partial [Acidobacteria bacterium]|nr:hypothetical protein [Acidobacteriota bacterium]